ncbi:hypothetical protein BX661DRAFT_168909 [Kickxella alabastrina]|uniref:uncharacterized protein n=1 Tax=Kickxella alabastrina TaxID=61397 RepID=UPI002220F1F3|nr:uncharacterized protein BX661DRAFT_168909 [Kickxella alabastrina]KAI7833783.1 hypothetical protein BX661DRAFT_168909 [Kickxella alabastrina]
MQKRPSARVESMTQQSTDPLHPKLCYVSFVNRKRADVELTKSLRPKFGSDPVPILGNWTPGMAHYHEPIRGKGERPLRFLRKNASSESAEPESTATPNTLLKPKPKPKRVRKNTFSTASSLQKSSELINIATIVVYCH